MTEQIDAARLLLRQSIAECIFPAASVEVGSRDGVIWCEAFGTSTFDASSTRATDETIFDLASLTKPIATTSVVLQLIASQALSFELPLAAAFPEWNGPDRASATV